MRLTVHVTGAKKYKVEKKMKDGTIKTWWKCNNTLSYKGVEKDGEANILAMIESSKLGKPFKSYFSNEK